MRNTDHEQSPYTRPAEVTILQRGKDEYAKLLKEKRVREGRGKNWRDGLQIEGCVWTDLNGM